MRVILHIDRLVLRGFPPADRDRIAAELRGELSRLLADGATAGNLAARPHAAALRVAPTRPSPQGTPLGSGISAARSIARGLVR